MTIYRGFEIQKVKSTAIKSAKVDHYYSVVKDGKVHKTAATEEGAMIAIDIICKQEKAKP